MFLENMDFELWYTAFILLLMTIVLATELFKPDITILGALLLLTIGGVVSVDEAFAGFANKGMLAVGFLFVVSTALQSSSSFDKFIYSLLGDRQTPTVLRYLRLMIPVATLSAFLNNTPIVATLIPVVKNWAKRMDQPASKFLIPLSYAAILGGTCTLIGTSTNLVVHGMLLDHGLDGFSFFELTKISLPLTVILLFGLSLVSYFVLPSKKDPIVDLGDHTREFVVEMSVSADYPGLNQTVDDAKLRHLQGLFLFQIIRDGEIIAPVAPDEIILEKDRLFFTGLPETIYELQKMHGLYAVRDSEFNLADFDSDQLNTYEAVISERSSLVGQSVRESNFRSRFDAVILAIHRSGHRINKKVGDIVFRPGDTLFILSKKGFDARWYHSPDFLLVSPSLEVFSKPRWKGNLALGLLILMILVATTGIMPMVLAAACTAVLMVALRIISVETAQKSVDWGVLLAIASAFGVGRALENSGLATWISTHMIDLVSFFGPVGVIAGIFFLTSIYTEMITNNAAAAIMFPIALEAAQTLSFDPKLLVIPMTIAASASFATPIGYQTNLMVYGPGGYCFRDFLKIGVPMNVMTGIGVTLFTYFWFF